MQSVYQNAAGERAVRQWCEDELARARFRLTTATVDTSAGRVALTTAGNTGPPRIVLVPGTAFNAAVVLPWLQALSTSWTTTVVDLPGQPGLSDPRRPRRSGQLRLAWYGGVVNEVLAAIDADQVVLVGKSLGAAVALAADAHSIAARVLISPAGFIRLSVDPRLALASAAWLLRPTPDRTRRMLRLFVAPDDEPPETEVEWMSLMASHCRTTLAPPPLPADLLARRAEQPCVVAVGEHDRFLPPHRLAPAVRRTMNVDTHVLPHAGHLTTPAQLHQILSFIADVTGSAN